MAAGPVDPQGHHAALLEPAAEQQIMFPFVGAMLLDFGDEARVAWPPGANRRQHPIDRRVAAMLVVDVDRPQHVEITVTQYRQHAGDALRRYSRRQALTRRNAPWSWTALPRPSRQAPARSA